MALGEAGVLRWCKIAAKPNLIALLSTDNPTNSPSARDSSPLLETDTNDHYASPRASADLPPHSVPLKDLLPILFKLLATQDANGVFDFCKQIANTKYCNLALVWISPFELGILFSNRKMPRARKQWWLLPK